MRTYSRNQCIKYAKRILEARSIEDAAAEDPGKTRSELSKYIKVAGTGAIGALACCKFLSSTFSINTWQTAGLKLQNGVSTAAESGTFRFMIEPIWTPIKNAFIRIMAWVTSLAQSIKNSVGFLRIPIGSEKVADGMDMVPKYTVGSILSMALVGAAVGAVIYKLYKVLKRRRSTAESVSVYRSTQVKRLKKALAETNSMFNELTMLTEDASILTGVPDKTERMFQATHGRSSSLMGTTTTTATEAAKKVEQADGFIASMYAKLGEMWNTATTWCGNHMGLLISVGACLALVACWYGIKKSRDKGELEMTESFRPARRTRRMVRKSAYSF